MTKTRQGKLRLLQGVSAVLALSAGISSAHAQSVNIGSDAIDAYGSDGVVSSKQENPDNVTANATNTDVTTSVYDVDSGSVVGGGNTTGSAALGNLDTLTFTDIGSAVNATSDAMVALQTNTDATVTANTTGTTAGLYADDATDSLLTVNGGSDTSTATGNSVNQTMTVSATDLTLGTASATGNSIGGTDLDVDAKATAASMQVNTNADAIANTTGSTIELTDWYNTRSTLSLGGNVQGATATGSTATNGITVNGTSLGIGAAIASQQQNDVDSEVTALTEGSAKLQAYALDGSSASISGNKLQSQATGLTTSNTLTATGTNVSLVAADLTAAAVVSGGAGTFSAAFATLNDQEVGADVTATTKTELDIAAFTAKVTGIVDNSSLANDGNAVTAKAQGAVTSNLTTLTVAASLDTAGSAAEGGIANGATITNVQNINSAADVTATIQTVAEGDTLPNTIVTYVGDTLTDSSVSTSSNKLMATAEGANATNVLSVSATDLSVAADIDGIPSVGSDLDSVATADTAFSVLNVQTSGIADVTANAGDMATVYTTLNDSVTSSSVTSNSNTIAAFSTSNKAANGLNLSGTSVAGDAGLLNVQASSSDVSALVGLANDAGAIVEANFGITDSSIAVNGNIVQGSAVNNSVNNQMAITATTLDGGGTSGQAYVSGSPTFDDGDIFEAAAVTANADYALANLQTVDSNSSTNTGISTTFGIDQAIGETLLDSKLSVSGNTQFGEALGNTATNRLTLNATDAGAGITPTAALASTQEGASVNIDSWSDMNVYVSAASDGSSISMNGNSNTALAVVNNASNAVSFSATSLAGEGWRAEAYSDATAYGDVALNSYQTASGALDSTANTDLYNLDNGGDTNAGTLDSTVSIASNATTAEASANRVANSVSVSATSIGTAAALNNTQISSTTVNATATTQADYDMYADVDIYAAETSTISIDGNSTTALARGNTANNTLNYTALANFNGPSGTPTVDGIDSVDGAAALLNSQSNTGDVTATATNASYSVTLNDAVDSFGAASNSAVSVTNNTATAAAYGNSAVNTLAMGTFNAGIPSSGLSSVQYNGGAIVATATNVTYGVTMNGYAGGTSVRNTGNVVTAQAVGNSSVSTITGGN